MLQTWSQNFFFCKRWLECVCLPFLELLCHLTISPLKPLYLSVVVLMWTVCTQYSREMMHINNSPTGSAGPVALRSMWPSGGIIAFYSDYLGHFLCVYCVPWGGGSHVFVCVLGGEQGALWTSISDDSTVRKVDFPFYGASFYFSSFWCSVFVFVFLHSFAFYLFWSLFPDEILIA